MTAAAKFFTVLPSEMIQLADQVKMKLISKLIKSISRVLQKLLKYFNGSTISAFMI